MKALRLICLESVHKNVQIYVNPEKIMFVHKTFNELDAHGTPMPPKYHVRMQDGIQHTITQECYERLTKNYAD